MNLYQIDVFRLMGMLKLETLARPPLNVYARSVMLQKANPTSSWLCLSPKIWMMYSITAYKAP